MNHSLCLCLIVLTIFSGPLFAQTYQQPGVYVQEIPSGVKPISSVETKIPIFIGYTETSKRKASTPVLINSFSAYERLFGGPVEGFLLCESIHLFFQNGGKTCYVLSVGSTSQSIQRKALQQGLSKSQTTKAQLVLIPDAVALSANEFYALQNEMLRHCAKAKDRFAILNTQEPSADALQDFQAFRAGTSAPDRSWGAVYYPWLRNKDGKVLPPSGAIAGIYAQMDDSEGVWKAPANVSVQGIQSLTNSLNSSQQQAANINSDGKSINPIISVSGKGILVWGSRTLAGNDNEWRYVPVRRFAMMMEQSIQTGLGWVVFEPNDEPLWTSMQAVVSNYLLGLWRKGALQGTKPVQAFFVKCGMGETMTAQDVAEKRLILELGFAPLKPAEFVILRLEWRMK